MKHIPVLSILKYPDPRLLLRADPVLPEDMEEAISLADEMITVMLGVRGWGLAAPQVGVPWRMFIVGGPGTNEPTVVINPEIVSVSDVEVALPEGCLSFPGEHNQISRPGVIDAKWTNRYGEPRHNQITGWPARVFLHELDHLNGVLMIDHWLPAARKKLLKRTRASIKAGEG